VTFTEKFQNIRVDDDFWTDEADTPYLRVNSNRKTGIKIREK